MAVSKDPACCRIQGTESACLSTAHFPKDLRAHLVASAKQTWLQASRRVLPKQLEAPAYHARASEPVSHLTLAWSLVSGQFGQASPLHF
jgi:hypothetical protein